jgi:hypothetical protein
MLCAVICSVTVYASANNYRGENTLRIADYLERNRKSEYCSGVTRITCTQHYTLYQIL